MLGEDVAYSKEHGSSTADVDRGSDYQDDAGGVDAGDMYRMGKEQQFRVSSPAEIVNHWQSDLQSVYFESQP
jgi:hypothetical protein